MGALVGLGSEELAGLENFGGNSRKQLLGGGDEARRLVFRVPWRPSRPGKSIQNSARFVLLA